MWHEARRASSPPHDVNLRIIWFDYIRTNVDGQQGGSWRCISKSNIAKHHWQYQLIIRNCECCVSEIKFKFMQFSFSRNAEMHFFSSLECTAAGIVDIRSTRTTTSSVRRALSSKADTEHRAERFSIHFTCRKSTKKGIYFILWSSRCRINHATLVTLTVSGPHNWVA